MSYWSTRPRMPRPYRRPRWWPEDEEWPPQSSQGMQHWHRMRRTLIVRAAAAFLAILLVGGFACGGTLWLIGAIGGRVPGSSLGPWIMIVLGVVLLVGLLPSVRGVAMPLGDLIDAAGQVESGDFSVRLRERGPRELRALARAFNAMVERLRRTEAARRDLLADVTHELRTPVAVIQGNLEGMLDGVYPADAEHITPVLEETRVLSRLIDDLRTLSLVESGALELHRETTDLGVLIGDVVTSFRAQADVAGVRLNYDVSESLPLMEIDPLRIREVLANLAANALRHTPAGGEVRVTAALRPSGQGVEISVIDTGSGISPEDLPHVFDRFFKSRDSGGSGLGLAIARNLVQAHGGQVEAQSTLGRGTEIHVFLPTNPST